jgi:hypothetical protein
MVQQPKPQGSTFPLATEPQKRRDRTGAEAGLTGGSLLLSRAFKGQMPPAAPLPPAEKEPMHRWIKTEAPRSRVVSEQRAGRDWSALQPLRATTRVS